MCYATQVIFHCTHFRYIYHPPRCDQAQESITDGPLNIPATEHNTIPQFLLSSCPHPQGPVMLLKTVCFGCAFEDDIRRIKSNASWDIERIEYYEAGRHMTKEEKDKAVREVKEREARDLEALMQEWLLGEEERYGHTYVEMLEDGGIVEAMRGGLRETGPRYVMQEEDESSEDID